MKKNIFFLLTLISFLLLLASVEFVQGQEPKPIDPIFLTSDRGSDAQLIPFWWEVDGQEYFTYISEETFDYCRKTYKALPRLEEKSNTYSLGWDALAGYAQDGGPCQYNISTVAEQLFAEIEINKMTKLEATNFVLNFVRSIPYAEDPHDKDYPKYPYETILDLEGDCEDHAILFAAIMSLYGQDVILVRTINHLVPAVNMDLYMEKPPFVGNRAPSYVQFHGKTYYICEATSNETIREIWFQVNCGYNYPSDKKNKDSGTKSKDTKFEFIYPDLEPIYGAAKVEKNEKFVLKDIY